MSLVRKMFFPIRRYQNIIIQDIDGGSEPLHHVNKPPSKGKSIKLAELMKSEKAIIAGLNWLLPNLSLGKQTIEISKKTPRRPPSVLNQRQLLPKTIPNSLQSRTVNTCTHPKKTSHQSPSIGKRQRIYQSKH